eukprot:11631331-Alexandrium_andersonii.AAC.1
MSATGLRIRSRTAFRCDGSCPEDSSARALQTYSQGLQGARSWQGLGLRCNTSLLRASDPSGSRTSERL